jgi:hypothetical protein
MMEGFYTEPQILVSVRRSVKGMAGELLLHLGTGVSVSSIIQKFDVVFGNIKTAEQLLEEFYQAKQLETESVASWSCRLEELVTCIDATKSLPSMTLHRMMRERYWTGLYSDKIKTATRHKYDSGISWSELLIATRLSESEFHTVATSSKKKAQSSQQQVPRVTPLSPN